MNCEDSASKFLLMALLDIKTNGPEQKNHGICSAVRDLLIRARSRGDYSYSIRYPGGPMASLFESWPEFSGEVQYPVPACGRWSSPGAAYDLTDDEGMWSQDNPYGAARWRLVDYMISELSKDSEEVANVR